MTQLKVLKLFIVYCLLSHNAMHNGSNSQLEIIRNYLQRHCHSKKLAVVLKVKMIPDICHMSGIISSQKKIYCKEWWSNSCIYLTVIRLKVLSLFGLTEHHLHYLQSQEKRKGNWIHVPTTFDRINKANMQHSQTLMQSILLKWNHVKSLVFNNGHYI